jgi:hypothetical protein
MSRLRHIFIARTAPALLLAAATAVLAADLALTRKEADSMSRKVRLIVEQGVSPGKAERLTPVKEREVNAYLKFDAGPQIPVGVAQPSVSILGAGRLSGRAIVDLDAVREKKSSGGWFDPKSYLMGKLPVQVVGTLATRAGVGRFTLERAEISGIAIPKTLLQELLSYYSRTPENPQGIDLDEPFELPAAIREIRVGKGEAVVVQ